MWYHIHHSLLHTIVSIKYLVPKTYRPYYSLHLRNKLSPASLGWIVFYLDNKITCKNLPPALEIAIAIIVNELSVLFLSWCLYYISPNIFNTYFLQKKIQIQLEKLIIVRWIGVLQILLLCINFYVVLILLQNKNGIFLILLTNLTPPTHSYSIYPYELTS